MDKAEIRKRQLRWKCRRGMLELDIILTRFFDQCFDTLQPDELAAFEQVLDLEDSELWACFMVEKQHDDPTLQAMLQKIASVDP